MSDDVDHSKPHWCAHDGGDALIPPPADLYYLGAEWSTASLITRDCPFRCAGDTGDR